ncbi:MAG: ABC transporter ATP-binding protein [Candidatus Bathyarchaeia archaeon]
MGFHFHHMMLDEEELERKTPDRVLVARLVRLLVTYRRFFITAMATIVAGGILGLVPPYLVKSAVDDYIGKGDLVGLHWVAAIYLGVLLSTWAISYIRTYSVSLLGATLVMDLRVKLFNRLQELHLGFFERREAGRIMSRVTNDVDNLNQLLSMGFLNVVNDFLILMGVMIVLFLMDWRLALLSFVVVPLLFLTGLIFGKRARVAFRRTRRTISTVTSSIAESIAGIKVTQSFTRENENVRRFDQMNMENLQANMQAARISSLMMPLVDIIGALGTAIVYWFGGSWVIQGGLTVGALYAFVMYLGRFFMPIQDLTMFYYNLQSALAASERIFDLMDTRPEIKDAEDAVQLDRIEGHVRFDHVTFGYDPSRPVLKDVSLEAKPGERIALVGPTGAGKTTVVNLLTRFYEPQSGVITIDGHDIKKIRLRSLRSRMGIVPQDSYLFSGTIKENIKYGRRDATDDEMVEAAKIVGAHDFIVGLEKGYDTEVGERGARLSIGQRQLICFTRALLADPRILVLDEATSSVDAYTEQIIQKALKRLLEGRTSFIIAHRLSTVRSADKILVIEDGRIVERGRHEELLAAGGVYKKLYEMQFKPLEEAELQAFAVNAQAVPVNSSSPK